MLKLSAELFFGCVVICGCVGIYLTAGDLAAEIAKFLPLSFTVASPGWNPDLKTQFPDHLRSMSVIILISMAAMRLPLDLIASHFHKRWQLICAALIFLGACAYGYISYPHNGFASNSRMSWVDVFDGGYTKYSYPFPVVWRYLFFQFPHLLMVFTAAVSSIFLYLIGPVVLKSRLLIALAIISFFISSNALLFSDTSEDVHITFAVTFACLYFYSASRWFAFGVAIALLYLTRISMFFGIFSFLASELFVLYYNRRLDFSGFKTFFCSAKFLKVSLVSGSIFLSWNCYLYFAGKHFLFNGLSAGISENLKLQVVQGFEIHKFSGAYIGHFFWTFPIVVVIGILGSIVPLFRRKYSLQASRALFFCGFSILCILLIMELNPLDKYSVRYLVYALPFLLVGIFIVLDNFREAIGCSSKRIFLALIVTLSFTSTHSDLKSRFDFYDSKPIAELYSHRFDLWKLSEGLDVYTNLTAKSTRNYLCYLFDRRFHEIKHSDHPPQRPGPYVFVSRVPIVMSKAISKISYNGIYVYLVSAT